MHKFSLLWVSISLTVIVMIACLVIYYQTTQQAISENSKVSSFSTPSPSLETPTTPMPQLPSGWTRQNTPDQHLSLALPPTVKMLPSEDSDRSQVIWFGDVDNSAALVISYGKIDESLPGWSGLPAGDSQAAPDIEFLNQSLSKERLVYQGQTMKIFYGESPLNRSNMQFRISMDWFSSNSGGISISDETLADQIISLILVN